MAKETNHRRKSKAERKVEELDVEALTKELVKPKPQPRKPKYDKSKDRREPQQGDKRKDFKQKPKQNNQNNKCYYYFSILFFIFSSSIYFFHYF